MRQRLIRWWRLLCGHCPECGSSNVVMTAHAEAGRFPAIYHNFAGCLDCHAEWLPGRLELIAHE